MNDCLCQCRQYRHRTNKCWGCVCICAACVLRMEHVRSSFAVHTCSVWCALAENRRFCGYFACKVVHCGFCRMKTKLMLFLAKPFEQQ